MDRARTARHCAILSGVATDVRSEIEEICAFEARLPGSDAERRAANRIAAELEGPARRVEVEPTYVQPQWAIVHLLHCAIAVVASMIAGFEPAVSFALVLLTATSAYLDLSARHYALRRLLFRRASQNVHARAPAAEDSPRVIVCANVDCPRTGAAYNRLPTRLLNAAARRFPVVSSPTRIWFWSIALLLPPIGARMAGVDADWLAIAQLPQTLILIVACFLLGEIAISPASPGANQNASGVAAALALGRRLDADPPEALSVDIAICGGGETTMEGMRAFVRAHRKALDRSRTRFVSLESVGRGKPRFAVSQGLAVSLAMNRELVGLAEALALSSDDPEEPAATPIRTGGTSAAYVAAAHRFPAIAITCREGGEALPEGHGTPSDTPEAVDPAAIERAVGFAEGLIRLLDRDVARRGSRAGADAEPAAPRPRSNRPPGRLDA